jgi:hypothetical protein
MTMSACGWQSLRAPEPPEQELALPPPRSSLKIAKQPSCQLRA